MTKKVKSFVNKYEKSILLLCAVAGTGLFTVGINILTWPKKIQSRVMILDEKVQRQEECCHNLNDLIKDKITKEDLIPLEKNIEDARIWLKELYLLQTGSHPRHGNEDD